MHGSPMNRAERKKFARTQVRGAFAKHTLRPAPPVKTWYLRADSFAYSFTVTWTPGRLQISGDIGTCAYEGPTFFRSWPEAAEAVIGCDFDYLTSKTDIREVYDPEATARDIYRMMTEEAVRSRKEERQERQRWRRELHKAERADREWHLGDDEYGPIWFEPDLEAPAITARPRSPYDLDGLHIHLDPVRYDVPDGWEGLHRLRKAVATWLDDNAIFTVAGRRHVKAGLQAHCEDAGAASDLCSRLGLDDYYGTYNLPSGAIWYFEALQTWASLVVQSAEFEQAIIPCRAWQLEEGRRWALREEMARAARRHDATLLAIADDDGMPARETA